MNFDEMEAETDKYGETVVMVMKLSSGAYAVFNHKRERLAICSSILNVQTMIDEAIIIQQQKMFTNRKASNDLLKALGL